MFSKITAFVLVVIAASSCKPRKSSLKSISADPNSKNIALMFSGQDAASSEMQEAMEIDLDRLMAWMKGHELKTERRSFKAVDRNTLLSEFERALVDVGEHGTLIFLYAGHGQRDALAPVMMGSNQAQELVSYAELNKVLRRVRMDKPLARLVIILDACFSGSVLPTFGAPLGASYYSKVSGELQRVVQRIQIDDTWDPARLPAVAAREVVTKDGFVERQVVPGFYPIAFEFQKNSYVYGKDLNKKIDLPFRQLIIGASSTNEQESKAQMRTDSSEKSELLFDQSGGYYTSMLLKTIEDDKSRALNFGDWLRQSADELGRSSALLAIKQGVIVETGQQLPQLLIYPASLSHKSIY